MNNKKFAMGIDLGTTNSAGATIDEAGRPVIARNLEGENTTPSVVCILDKDEIIVGREAKNAAVANPETTIIEVKRQMGIVGADGKPVPCLVDKGVKEWIPEEISALILKKIKTDVETQNGMQVGMVVVTVPAYFTEVERQATINAAKIAGFETIEIVNEPTAAALYYGIMKKTTGKRVYVIYDLGGGTFDVSVISVENENVETIATDGVRRLGGTDWDMRIISRLAREAKKKGVDMDAVTDPAVNFDVKDRAERLKLSLTAMSKATMAVQINGQVVSFEYTREEFEKDTEDLLKQTGEKLRDVLASKNLSFDAIDGILLVGGASKMPMVQRYLREISGKDPLRDADPDLVVAMGAALAAAKMAKADGLTVLTSKGQEVKALPGGSFTNCTAFALGCAVFVKGGEKQVFEDIIPKNAQLPAKETKTFAMMEEGQMAAEVRIYQGQKGQPLEECLFIDSVLLDGLPAGTVNEQRIEVTYGYTRSGIIRVTVRDLKSNKTKEADVSHNSGMTKEEVRQAAKEVKGM